MTTGTDEKKPDPMAKARAAQAAKREAAKASPAQDGRFEQLMGAIGGLTELVKKQDERINALTERVERPKMQTVKSPEITVAEAMKSVKSVGDSADIARTRTIAGKAPTAFNSRDMVMLVPTTEEGIKKEASWRKAIKLPEGEPIVGQVLQFLGVDSSGSPKYRIQLPPGIGKDGIVQDDLRLHSRAS